MRHEVSDLNMYTVQYDLTKGSVSVRVGRRSSTTHGVLKVAQASSCQCHDGVLRIQEMYIDIY